MAEVLLVLALFGLLTAVAVADLGPLPRRRDDDGLGRVSDRDLERVRGEQEAQHDG